MPVSTVSRKIAELEDRLGVRLLERSTRQLKLTDVGIEVLEHAQKSVEISDAVEGVVSRTREEVSGTLRLSAPPNISDSLLVPIVTSFQEEYPEVSVHILVTDRFVDHIAEGVDLVFRVGPLDDSNLVARKVLRYRHQLVASPKYLESHDAPAKPLDLLKHRLHAFSFWSPSNRWTFVHGGKSETIKFKPCLAMNDYLGLATALAAGAGIGDLPPVVCPELIRQGKLVEVMPDWRFRTEDVSLVHLSNRHIPKLVRLFKEYTTRRAPALFQDLPN
ncbi:D-malate degradation protein R [Roseibium album]|nr:D-malate degradation protein R [Roseibium album]